MLYLVIGLKQDGRMGLGDAQGRLPTVESLIELAKAFNYVQVLVVSSEGIQVTRFEANLVTLKQVDLA